MYSYQIYDIAQGEIHFYTSQTSDSILYKTFCTLWHVAWDEFQMTKKNQERVNI